MLRITVWTHITSWILCTCFVITNSIILDPVRTPASIDTQREPVYIAQLGKLFYICCLAYGEPPPQVAWYRIKSNSIELVTTGKLLELNISSQTVGEYVCQANNSADHVATWVIIIQAYQTEDVETDNPHILQRLNIENLKGAEGTTRIIGSSGPVRSPAGIVGKQGTVFTAELGKSFETWCLAYGEPPPEVAWYRIKSNATVFVTTGNLLQLKISSQTVGDYVCQASNSADHVATWLVIVQTYQTENVQTEYNPHILQRLNIENLKDAEGTTRTIGSSVPVRSLAGIIGKQGTVFTIELGKSFETWCLAYGEPPPKVAWYRIKSNATVFVITGNLLQLNISSQTVGDYVCQASNSADHVATWLVIVQTYQTENVQTEYNPHILQRLNIENLKDAEGTKRIIGSSGPVRSPAGIVGKQGTVFTAEMGKSFEIWCLAYGEPPPEVAWYRTKSNGMVLVNTGNLLQLNISSQTVGDYVCQANNSANHVATWLVIIQAYQTEDVVTDNPHILPRLTYNYLRDMKNSTRCTDNIYFANCSLIVRSKFCQRKYYSKFCCKSCVEAGQLSSQ